MRTLNQALGAAVVMALLTACAGGSEDAGADAGPQGGEVVESSGTVVWRTVEGGVWVIEADNGTTYNPIDLPEDYQVDGLRVHFEGQLRTDMMGIHMVGPLIEITSIREL